VQQWEYRVDRPDSVIEPEITSRLARLGKEGWELVTIDRGLYIFKRPQPTA
jgi:hypothetical protein